MKFLYDFFPVILFFVAYKIFPGLSPETIAPVNQLTSLGLDPAASSHAILFATLVAIIASFIQVSLYRVRHGRFERMHLVSLGILTLVGGATLVLRDPIYFMWKPTLLNWLFALIFLGSMWIGSKPLVERMMGGSISVPSEIWKRLNLAWVGFFILTGVLNILVAYQFSEETWVNFKMFGLLGLTVLFIFLQAFYLARYMP
ncbi:MAG: septation protein A, partial [Gammaproteobacteria bacterium]|nr:septation protein A [Gammaproteobacteria bacterium]